MLNNWFDCYDHFFCVIEIVANFEQLLTGYALVSYELIEVN